MVSVGTEEVKWAFFIVNSRAWRDNDGATYFFQPLGDMVEHSAEGNVETSISKAGRTSLIARTDIEAGTPLTFTQRVDQAGPFFCQVCFVAVKLPASGPRGILTPGASTRNINFPGPFPSLPLFLS